MRRKRSDAAWQIAAGRHRASFFPSQRQRSPSRVLLHAGRPNPALAHSYRSRSTVDLGRTGPSGRIGHVCRIARLGRPIGSRRSERPSGHHGKGDVVTIHPCLRLILSGAALAASVALVASPSRAADKEVTFAYQDMVVPMRTLMQSGEIEKATGYKITWRKFGGGGDVIRAMASGNVAIGEAGSSPIAAAASQGSRHPAVLDPRQYRRRRAARRAQRQRRRPTSRASRARRSRRPSCRPRTTS